VAELKRYLKEIPGSKFMADRRNNLKDRNVPLQVYNRKEKLLKVYRPLGQILVEKKFINDEQLQEALKVHWRRDVALGETLKDLGLANDGQIREALGVQRQRIREVTEENEAVPFGQSEERMERDV
jgi:hypothetical protein